MELLKLGKMIKPQRIKILSEAGIDSIESLAMRVPWEPDKLDGISSRASKSLIWTARVVV